MLLSDVPFADTDCLLGEVESTNACAASDAPFHRDSNTVLTGATFRVLCPRVHCISTPGLFPVTFPARRMSRLVEGFL